MGTPSYMSPEQIMGLPVDGRSDLFSAGVILYQFLTGERPFAGSATATMHKVLEEDPLPPSRFNVQVPGAMDAVVRKALAKRPDERYQNAEEFAAALRAAADATPTQPTTTDATVLAAAPEATLIAPASATTHPADRARHRRGEHSAARSTDRAPAKKPQTTAIAIVAAVAVLALGAGSCGRYSSARRTIARNWRKAPAAPTAAPPAASAPLPRPHPRRRPRGEESRSRHA